jgi:hypothetical protein
MDDTEMRLECTYWTHLAQNRNQCRAIGNAIMNLRVP